MIDAATPTPTPRRRNRVARAAIVVSAVLVVAVLGFVAFVYVSLEGGIDGFLANRRSAPDPVGERIVDARARAVDELTATFAALEDPSAWTRAASGGHDVCYRGQNNWKVKDGYAYRCSYRMTRAYGVDGDIGARLLALEKRLSSAGWSNSYRSITEVVAERDAQEFRGAGPYYDSVGGSGHLYLEVGRRASTSGATSFGQSQRVSSSYDMLYEVDEVLDGAAVFRQATQQHEFVVMLSIERDYYSK